ncbi:MAG: hypothetical protein COA78_30190 [Blastopirellula sp.]|nr:MAG: hypothetical protein COA78_30190 [Blastopirellula sp.]
MKLLITTFAVVAVMTLGASSAFAERGHSSHSSHRGHSSHSGYTSHYTSRGHFDYNTHYDVRYVPSHGHYHVRPHTTRTFHATPYRSGYYSSRYPSYYSSRYNSHSSGGFRYSGRNFSIGIGF